MKKGLIFDMDGTLWDSSDNVAKSWNIALKNLGYKRSEITQNEIKSIMGKTMDEIALIVFPNADISFRKNILDECCREENNYLRKNGGELYENLEKTLTELRKKYSLYIVSNCQSGYIEAFLDYYGFRHLFEDTECFGNNGLGKGKNIRLLFERNALSDAAYIGDIQGDYDATMEAGLKFIHAAYGFGKINTDTPKIMCVAELLHVADEVLGK